MAGGGGTSFASIFHLLKWKLFTRTSDTVVINIYVMQYIIHLPEKLLIFHKKLLKAAGGDPVRNW